MVSIMEYYLLFHNICIDYFLLSLPLFPSIFALDFLTQAMGVTIE
jgi:hypothetical protein